MFIYFFKYFVFKNLKDYNDEIQGILNNLKKKKLIMFSKRLDKQTAS